MTTVYYKNIIKIVDIFLTLWERRRELSNK